MSPVLAALAVKSVALLGAASLVAMALRKTSAAARHLWWTAAFLGLLLLPLLSVSLPAAHFAPAEKMLAPVITFTVDSTSTVTRSASVSLPNSTPPRPGAHRRLPDFLAILWLAGALLGCARLLLACIAMARVRSRSRSLASAELRELAPGKHVELRETTASSMPMTAGWLRPAIFLPADASTWTAEKRRAVLLHELAHVRRADVATQLLARLAVSLYWWNPLAWFAWREFLMMRERAADDLVLECGTTASAYAGHLLEIARSTASPAIAAIAMAQPSQLESRLQSILDSRVPRSAPGRFAIAITAIAAALLVAPLAAIHAQDDPLPADAETTIRVANSQNNFAMLDRAAEGFIKNRQYETARKLLEASLQIRAAAGKNSAEYSDGLIKLGDLSWDYYMPRAAGHAAKDYYQQAVVLGDRPETAPALLRLGILNLHKPEVAEGYLQRAINAGAKGSNYGEALAWMGEIRNQQGNAAEADALFVRARSAVKKGSAEAALVGEMYAAFLTAHNRKDEAQPMIAEAAAYRTEHIASLSPAAIDAASAKRIGGGVTAPGVVKKIEPGYRGEAAALKIQGTVTLGLIIGPDGRAGNIVLKRGIGFGLDERALEAVSQWTFQPATSSGTPVPVFATIEVNFRLL